MTRLGDFLLFGQLFALWATFCSLGNFLKPLAAINLPKSSTFLGNFCKGVKINHFSTEIIFGQLFIDIWQFFTGHTVRDVSQIGMSDDC